MKSRRIFPDLTNETFGRLKVLYRDENAPHYTTFVCECACGKFPTVRACCLVDGMTKSCGCLRREIAVKKIATGICERSFKHGCARRTAETKEHKSWANFKAQGKNVPNFLAFLEQVGTAPTARSRLYQQSNGSFRWA